MHVRRKVVAVLNAPLTKGARKELTNLAIVATDDLALAILVKKEGSRRGHRALPTEAVATRATQARKDG